MDEPRMEDGAFEATRTILAPMPVLGIPEVLLDEGRGLMSVRLPGADTARILRCADILSCEIYEVEGEEEPVPEGWRGLGEVFKNPLAVARGNAVRRHDRIFGAGVMLALAGSAEPVPLCLWPRQLKRGTRAYRNIMESARELKHAIDEARAGGPYA